MRLASVWSSPNLFAAGSILGGGCCLDRGRGAIISGVLIACIRSVGGTYIELRVNSSRRYCYITTCKRMLHKVMRQGLGIFITVFAPSALIFLTIIHVSLLCTSINKAKLQISHYVCAFIYFLLQPPDGSFIL